MEVYLSFVFLLYSILITRFYKNLLNKCKKVHDRDFSGIDDMYKPFVRYDYKNWSHLEIYLGAIFLLPMRLSMIFISLMICYLSLWIGSIGVPLKQEWPMARYQIVRFFVRKTSRLFMYSSGFFPIKTIKVKYSMFDSEYRQSEEDRLAKPGFIISNHQSWYDTIFYVSEYMPSYISKDAVAKYPIFGSITIALKSLFVDRGNRQEKDEILNKMIERSKLIKDGKVFPPVMIFPEGTTTNGKYLISFKKGAFESLQPLKIACLKYYDRRLNLSLDKLDLLGSQKIKIYFKIDLAALSLVQFYNKLEFYEFEGLYNPQHLELEKYPEEKRWEIYADKVKDIMAKCLGKQKSDAGYRHTVQLTNEYYNCKSKSN